MANIEILAPVGSEEMLHAAVFSGADAVYLGFSGFNARTGAGNFDADSLKEAVRFCHARGVKVHVALNTTVYGGELASLCDAIRAVAASGADAVICQDLAVATLIGKIAPQLPRHGSTQMSVHTLQGALDAQLKKREGLRPWPVQDVELEPLPQRTLPPHRTLRARFERWDQVPEQALSGVEYLILPIAQADRVPREWRGKTLLELPRVMFGKLEEDTARRVAATQDAGFAGYEVSNIAHLRLCRGLPMSGGFGLNVTNQVAAQFYADNGLGSVLILPETKDSDISTIAPTHAGKPVPTGVLVYGHMPLMVTRACPLQNIHDCAHCDKTGVLTDRKAKKFPVRCGLGVRTIYNPVPIYMGDKPGALTVDYGVAYFTLESREEAAKILEMIRTHAPFEGDFTRGLYFKGTN